MSPATAPTSGAPAGAAPRLDIGNTFDWVANLSSPIISNATGTFPDITGLTSETCGAWAAYPINTCVGGNGTDGFTLQINSQNFWTTSVYTGSTSTKAWEQFVFLNPTFGGAGTVEIEYWLFGWYTAHGSCPSSVTTNLGNWERAGKGSPDCTAFSGGKTTPNFPITDLSSMTFSALADYKGSGFDVAKLCVSGTCYMDSVASNVLNLYEHWYEAEFNVFGAANGTRANFNTGTAIEVLEELRDGSGDPITPSCVNNGTTGEGNNLYLGICSGSSSGLLFYEATQNYGITSSPASVTMLSGRTATYPLTVTLWQGTGAPVTLSVVSGLPVGATPSFSTNPVTPTGSSTLTISTPSSVALGDYTLLVYGQFGAFLNYTVLTLHIYNFAVSISPSTQTVLRGLSAQYKATLTLSAGSSTTGIPSELMSVTGLPSDATWAFGPSNFIPTFGGNTATFTVYTHGPPSGSLGDYTFTITGTDPYPSGGSRSGSAHLHIFDFSVILTPISRTTLRGTTTVYDLQLKLLGGSSTTGIPAMSMSISGGPSDTVYTLSATSMTPTVPGCSVSTPADCQTVTAVTAGPPSGSLGNFTFTVTATDPSGGSRSTVPPGQLHIFDFTVTLAPEAETVVQGGTVTMSVTLTLVPGSTTIGLPAISMSLLGLPSDVVSVGFPSTMTIGETATFTLESSSVASYINCPEVVNGGGQFLPHADLAHCNLAGYDLAGDDLFEANLLGANLEGADLEDANLIGANLASANLMGTDFQGADLAGADLSSSGPVGLFVITVVGSVDGGSRTSNASLLLVLGDELSGDDFQGADLAQTNLTWDVLTGYVDDFTDFNMADLDGANLTAAVCGAPNNITAAGAEFLGIINVPAACNPPIGLALGGTLALAPPMGTASSELGMLALVAIGLAAFVAAFTRRRPRRPRSSKHTGKAAARSVLASPDEPPGRTGLAPVYLSPRSSPQSSAGRAEQVLRRARTAQAMLEARGDLESAWKLGRAADMLAELSRASEDQPRP